MLKISLYSVTKLAMVSSIALALAMNTGCASIIDGEHQSVSVQTPPAIGAMCSLKNNKGQWFISQTPGSVTVHKSYEPLTVSCTKNGYAPATLAVKSHTKGMAFGNILFGGGIGAGVDVADGAAYDYPTNINVPMQR